jgi:hypothetical protein
MYNAKRKIRSKLKHFRPNLKYSDRLDVTENVPDDWLLCLSLLDVLEFAVPNEALIEMARNMHKPDSYYLSRTRGYNLKDPFSGLWSDVSGCEFAFNHNDLRDIGLTLEEMKNRVFSRVHDTEQGQWRITGKVKIYSMFYVVINTFEAKLTGRVGKKMKTLGEVAGKMNGKISASSEEVFDSFFKQFTPLFCNPCLV